jgi:hypothetical protein
MIEDGVAYGLLSTTGAAKNRDTNNVAGQPLAGLRTTWDCSIVRVRSVPVERMAMIARNLG